MLRGRGSSIPGLAARTAGLLGVVDLGLELPVALAVRAGRIDRVDRDDLLAGVTVLVEVDVTNDRAVGVVGGRAGDSDRLAKGSVVGRVGLTGSPDGVDDDLGAGEARARVARRVDPVL